MVCSSKMEGELRTRSWCWVSMRQWISGLWRCVCVGMVMSWEWLYSLRLKVKGWKGVRRGHDRSGLRKRAWMLVRAGGDRFCWGESGHRRLMGILPYLEHWSLQLLYYFTVFLWYIGSHFFLEVTSLMYDEDDVPVDLSSWLMFTHNLLCFIAGHSDLFFICKTSMSRKSGTDPLGCVDLWLLLRESQVVEPRFDEVDELVWVNNGRQRLSIHGEKYRAKNWTLRNTWAITEQWLDRET